MEQQIDAAADEGTTDGVLERYGTWAVTAYGVESLTHEYAIEAARLWLDWETHLAMKRWVVLADARAALAAGRRYHGVPRRDS